MNEKLKPCPFCGSEKLNVYEVGGFDSYGEVRCSCGAKTQVAYTKADAIAAWNRRQSENSIIDRYLRDFQLAHGDADMVMDAATVRDLAYSLHNDIPLGYEASNRLGHWLLDISRQID